MKLPRIALALASQIALTPIGSAGASAETKTVTTDYGMAIIGLLIGKASFDTVIDGSRFSVDGHLSSAGLGALVSETKGTSHVSGRFGSGGFSAQRYGLDYTSDSKRWKSDVRFNDGRVTFASVSPKRSKHEKPTYIPVEKSQLAAVVDPLSGMMIKTTNPASVCQRTLPLFDGWSRLDLELSPGGSNSFKMPGYNGPATVCEARIDPVSGYDTASKGLKFLKDQTIQLWFAPIAQKDVFVPVYARIPTTIGPLTLQALSVAVK
ncbi:DUF3108 domain-containing protein [Jiella sp. M17.18]|uniref:DUF3108 domain-containing protein n=1 Tax=Jiella sp. M17.18 TaxID=3234247 RepID=UPI0034DEFE8C